MGGKRKHSFDGQFQPLANQFASNEPPVADPLEAIATRERRYADLYSNPPDFKLLASKDPEFAAVYVVFIKRRI